MSVNLPNELQERLNRIAARCDMDPDRFAVAVIAAALDEAEAGEIESSDTVPAAKIKKARTALAQVAAGETLTLEEARESSLALFEARLRAAATVS
jgi:predicted transcriptional regulator